MANQLVPVGNSGSLEDCHTNLYELTDIAGIQYKKFIPLKENLINSLDDPILELYTSCVQAGILCSWINTKKEDKFSSLSDFTGYRRELWIFWYDTNEDPLPMKHITVPNMLREDEKGNWKNGLTYEIRSILFKSITSYFQRHFMNKGYVRMGLWYQMLYRPDRSNECQYGFNIKLFLHGESTICGTIDVRNVSVIRQITEQDMQDLNSNKKIEVILAPYGVKAQLTGRVLNDDDYKSKHLQDAWMKYYPLTNLQKTGLKSKFVEIIVGNYKMEYPACFVCVQLKGSVKKSRKRTINEITNPNSQLYSYVGRKISDKIMKQSMIPLVNSLKKQTNRRCWKYNAPFSKIDCGCGNCLAVSNRLSIDNSADSTKTNTSLKTFHKKLKCTENQINCDKTSSPQPVVTNQNDPSMPTLSPQMPQANNEININNSHRSSTNNQNNNMLNELLNHPNNVNTSKTLNIDINETESNEKYPSILNKPPHPNTTSNILNQMSVSNLPHLGCSVVNSSTPPPPSITPTNNNSNNTNTTGSHFKSEHINVSESIKTESNLNPLGDFHDKRCMEALPIGIEITNHSKPVLSKKPFSTNINIINKSPYTVNRNRLFSQQPPQTLSLSSHSYLTSANSSNSTTENGTISDVSLHPSLDNKLNEIDEIYIKQNKSSESSTDSLLTNCWLSFSNDYSEYLNSDESPVTKKARRNINCSGSNMHQAEMLTMNNSNEYSNNFPSVKSEMTVTNNCRMLPHTMSSSTSNDSNKFYIGSQNEKMEPHSNIPDQIFDDSDEEDSNMKSLNSMDIVKYEGNNNPNNPGEIIYNTTGPPTFNHINNNRINIPDKLMSPVASQVKIIRSSNPHYNKLCGTSICSSNGSGNFSGAELSFMYLTPPSHEGEGPPNTIGSPAERPAQSVPVNNSSTTTNTTSLADLHTTDTQYLHNHSYFNHHHHQQHYHQHVNYPNSSYHYNQPSNTAFLNNLSLTCQNWDELDKDWSSSPINSSLFCPNTKYTKDPEPTKHSIPTFSFNHRQYHYQMKVLEAKKRHLQIQQQQQQLHQQHHSHQQQYSPRRPNAIFNQPKQSQKSPIIPTCTTSNTTLNSPNFETLRRANKPSLTILQPTLPIVNSLYFIVLLSDSILDVYRDHNFDSCNICVCSMSVLGNEIGLYIDDYQQLITPLPPNTNSNNQNQSSVPPFNRSISSSNDDLLINSAGFMKSECCKCGFSAVRNRHYAVNSNLFYEDELDITGNININNNKNNSTNSSNTNQQNKDNNNSNNKQNNNTNVTKYLPIHLTSIYNEFGLGFLIDCYKSNNVKFTKKEIPENEVEFADFNKAISHALEQSQIPTEGVNHNLNISDKEKELLSSVFYFNKEAPIPKNHNDQIRLLMSLRPLLQEAVNNSRLSQSSYTVDGPLTWNTFHRLAGRKNLESCEPQPIPRILALLSKSHKEDNQHLNIPGLKAMRHSTATQQMNSLQSNNSQYSIYSHYPNNYNGLISNQTGYNGSTKKSNILKKFSLDGNPLCLSDGFVDREKECISISPYAIREWDKLNLEPIYKPKEIAFSIVTPTDSGKFLQKALLTYFKELTRTYQSCRLGHHFSYRNDKKQDDILSGFVEIDTENWSECQKNSNSNNFPFSMLKKDQPSFFQYWLRELSMSLSPTPEQQQHHYCAAEELLSRILWYSDQVRRTTTRELLKYGVNRRKGKQCCLFPLPNNSNNSNNNNNTNTNNQQNQIKQWDDLKRALELLLSPSNGCGSQSRALHSSSWVTTEQDLYLVIYVVNPFTFGQDSNEASHRLSIRMLNRACDGILSDLPASWRPRITFHQLSLAKLLSTTSGTHGNSLDVPGELDGSHPGCYDSHSASQFTTTSGNIPWWSACWSKSSRYTTQAFSLYSSIKRRVLRVSGLLQLLNQASQSNKMPLCTSDSRCFMGRLCQQPDVAAASLLNATRSLTGFGPSGDSEQLTADFLRKLLLECISNPRGCFGTVDPATIDLDEAYLTIYSPCYVLAPIRSLEYQSASYSANENRCLTANNNSSNSTNNSNNSSNQQNSLNNQNNTQNNHSNSNLLNNMGSDNMSNNGNTIGSNNNKSNSSASITNQISDSEFWGQCNDKSGVLFVAYCLSEDQRLLLVTCTDQRGTLLRQTQINIGLPASSNTTIIGLLRRNLATTSKLISPRRVGLAKLWDFIVDVVSETCQPWRLVIGRLGRAGHGELKGWNGLLSRSNLVRVNQKFRDECTLCNVWGGSVVGSGGAGASTGGVGPNTVGSNPGYTATPGAMGSLGRTDLSGLQCPALISGCFVSLETLSSFRIFPGNIKHEERASSQLQMCTPRDIGVTHILVFPTSTSAGAIQNDQDLSGNGMVNLDELLDIRFCPDIIDMQSQMDMNDNMDGVFGSYGGMGSLLGGPTPSMSNIGGNVSSLLSNRHDDHGGSSVVPNGSSAHSLMMSTLTASNHTMHGSGSISGSGNSSMRMPGVGGTVANTMTASIQAQEEGHILMQQPLAMGYYVSTAGVGGPLPIWIQPTNSPACFKAALHLQTSLISQEDGGTGTSGIAASPHPLDSHQTCDVLHFVLDSYHALSWLTIDPATNERRSCLPIHMLSLAQLYQADSIFL